MALDDEVRKELARQDSRTQKIFWDYYSRHRSKRPELDTWRYKNGQKYHNAMDVIKLAKQKQVQQAYFLPDRKRPGEKLHLQRPKWHRYAMLGLGAAQTAAVVAWGLPGLALACLANWAVKLPARYGMDFKRAYRGEGYQSGLERGAKSTILTGLENLTAAYGGHLIGGIYECLKPEYSADHRGKVDQAITKYCKEEFGKDQQQEMQRKAQAQQQRQQQMRYAA